MKTLSKMIRFGNNNYLSVLHQVKVFVKLELSLMCIAKGCQWYLFSYTLPLDAFLQYPDLLTSWPLTFAEPCSAPCICTWEVHQRDQLALARLRPPKIWQKPLPNSVWCSTAQMVWITLPWVNSSRCVEMYFYSGCSGTFFLVLFWSHKNKGSLCFCLWDFSYMWHPLKEVKSGL